MDFRLAPERRPIEARVFLATLAPVLLALGGTVSGIPVVDGPSCQDAPPHSEQDPRIRGKIVHDEDSTPLRRFRIYLRGEKLQGRALDGWEWPRSKGGWPTTPLDPSDATEEGDEGEGAGIGEGKAAVEAAAAEPGPKEYLFDRAVGEGEEEGHFEWVIEADGCDPARGFVDLKKGHAADLGEVRLRRASAAIEGRVLDAAGRPFGAVRVELTGLARAREGKRSRRDQVRTDVEGLYRFDRVPAGKGFVHVVPGPAPVMPAVPVTVARGGVAKADFRPEVGELRVRIELPEGTEWTRPFQFCLQMPERRMLARWRVFPPHPAPGQVFDAPRGGGSATVASPLSEEIELDPVGPGEPPLWEVEPPPVSGEGSPGDVAMGADGAAFGIANVPVGDWKVFLRRLERERAPDRTKGNRPGRLERELWEAPSFRPSPEKVKVRAGETASVVLLGR